MESGGGGGMSYAGKVGKGIKKRKKLNILDIILERKDNSVSYNLSKEELSKLLFKKMKIDPSKVIKVDTSAFRSIHVEFLPGIEPEDFSDLPAFEIRDGLRSKIYRPHHRKDTLVTVSWLDLETPDEFVSHVFGHFGTMKSSIKWCKIPQEADESEEAKLLNNILSGERQFWMEISKSLPSYASIDGRKVKIYHPGQKRTCARCQKDGEHCPGKANAKLCDENGGVKTNVETVWKEILDNVGYKEWSGEGIENDPEIEAVREDGEDTMDDPELPPIEGCTGIVLDNLEEDMSLDDIKAILQKVCPEDSLELCTLQPTGSLRSKIIENLETNLIQKITKKVDKTSFKGRMIFCKPFVPKTPPKANPAAGNETNHSSTTQTPSKQVIPGLSEKDRVKALKPREKKVKKSKDDKKGSKEEIAIKNLTQKDFLIIAPKVDDVSEKFVFSDSDDEFEESKEEIEDDDAFSTPITLKTAFAQNVAKSRSRSTSLKRQFGTPDAEDENKKRAKSLKSGTPATGKSLIK